MLQAFTQPGNLIQRIFRTGKARVMRYRKLMPIYVYETINPDGTGGDRFDLQHPETGQPVRRVMLPPNLASRYTPGQTRKRLDNKSVEKAGFTKYERDRSTGKYHRVAGNKGPETITRPDAG
jgi:hypothetical protein